jgi:hypothetical protein
LGDRLGQSLALHHGLSDLLQGVAIDRVVRRLRGDRHRTRQVDAGASIDARTRHVRSMIAVSVRSPMTGSFNLKASSLALPPGERRIAMKTDRRG